MKNLSRWGKNNPIKSRYIITFSYILIGINIIGLSLFFYGEGLELPVWALYASISVFFLSFILYPIKKRTEGIFKHSYAKQKAFDTILVMSGSFTFFIGTLLFLSVPINNMNQSASISHSPQSFHKTAFHVDGQRDLSKTHKEKFSMKEKVKQMRKGIKADIKAIKKAVKEQKKTKDDAGRIALKVLLVILTIAATVFLGLLVAALACSVACSSASGAGSGAGAILLLGWLALAALSVLTIRAIITKI